MADIVDIEFEDTEPTIVEVHVDNAVTNVEVTVQEAEQQIIEVHVDVNSAQAAMDAADAAQAILDEIEDLIGGIGPQSLQSVIETGRTYEGTAMKVTFNESGSIYINSLLDEDVWFQINLDGSINGYVASGDEFANRYFEILGDVINLFDSSSYQASLSAREGFVYFNKNKIIANPWIPPGVIVENFAPSSPGTLATEGYADDLIIQLINGAPSDANTLKELNDKITAINAIIGGATADVDSLVNTVAELLAVFTTYPEGTDVYTILSAKVNSSDIVNNLTQVVAGKVLDAAQGKVLKDLIDALTIVVSGKQANLTDTVLGALIHGYTSKPTLIDADETVSYNSVDGKAVRTPWLNVFNDYFKSKTDLLYLKKSKSIFASGGSLTGVATEGNIITFQIPANTFDATDSADLIAPLYKSATALALNYKVYWGASSGARTTLIATLQLTAGNRMQSLLRFIHFSGGEAKIAVPFATSNAAPFTAAGGTEASITIPFDTTSANNWITISGDPSVITEIVKVLDCTLKSRKP